MTHPLNRHTFEEAFRRLDDFLDRRLSPEETRLVEEHMAESERQMARLTRTGRIGPYEKDLIHADGTRSPMLSASQSCSARSMCCGRSPTLFRRR